MQLLLQKLYCIGSLVLLRSEFVGGLIDGATPLFVERSCIPHFDFTNIPISFNFEPSSLALLLEFAFARDFSFFSSISSSSFVDELSFLLLDLLFDFPFLCVTHATNILASSFLVLDQTGEMNLLSKSVSKANRRLLLRDSAIAAVKPD